MGSGIAGRVNCHRAAAIVHASKRASERRTQLSGAGARENIANTIPMAAGASRDRERGAKLLFV